MKVLVTGGAGFIGSHIVEQLVAAGHEPAVLDDLSTGKRENVPQGVRLYEADLRDKDATAKVLADFQPKVVSHQAAQASVPESVKNPARDVQINVVGGIRLLEACVAQKVERVVFASTGGAIYGEVEEPTRATESKPPTPLSPYAISKLALENLLNFYQKERGLASTVLRYANIYGPRQDAFGEAGVVAIFFERIRRGAEVVVFARRTLGDQGCVRDYTFVLDVARANIQALEGDVPHSVMNVGTGIATTTAELAARVQVAAGREVKVEHRDRRAGDLERSVLDPTLCIQLLGGLTPLDEGLKATAEAL